MENNTFKSVAFGGFAKQDVIDYIEKTARESAAVQEKLQQENESLQAEVKTLAEQLESARTQLESLQVEREQLAAMLADETARREALEPVKPEAERLAGEVERLTAETERLRPDAEAYAQFRERIGSIECEARKRAADLEDATQAKLRQVVDQFRARYVDLMATFDTTASHVTSELRKVEVNLSQLPRAMDQNGVQLNELAAVLEKKQTNY